MAVNRVISCSYQTRVWLRGSYKDFRSIQFFFLSQHSVCLYSAIILSHIALTGPLERLELTESASTSLRPVYTCNFLLRFRVRFSSSRVCERVDEFWMLDEGAYTQSKSQSIHYSSTRSHTREEENRTRNRCKNCKCKQAVSYRFPSVVTVV
jgi:hypothetical protein